MRSSRVTRVDHFDSDCPSVYSVLRRALVILSGVYVYDITSCRCFSEKTAFPHLFWEERMRRKFGWCGDWRASECLSANPLCPFKALASIPPPPPPRERPSRSLAHFGAGIPPCLFLPSLSSELIYGLPEKLHNFKRGNERGLHLGKAELEGALLQIGGGEAEDDMFTGGCRAWSLCQNHEREGGRAPRGKIICGRLRDP